MGTLPGTRCVLGQLVRDEIRRQDDQIAERAGSVQAGIRVANSCRSTAKEAVDLGELLERRLAIRPHQRIGQLHQDPVWLGVVDEGVNTVEIAQRALQPKSASFEHEPLVLQLPAPRSPDRQAQLEGHVESRRPTPRIDAAQIMKGIAACRNQLEDAVEPWIGARELQGRARSETETAEPGDESQE